MKTNYTEALVGLVVLIIAGYFGWFAYNNSEVSASHKHGYELFAKFSTAAGVVVGGDVKISGVKIGKITHISLVPDTYQAVVKMKINDEIKLPRDSSAKIVSEGLLGGKYMQIEPGGEEEFLEPGEEIDYTQSGVNLEELIGKVMFSGKSDDKAKSDNKDSVNEKPEENHKDDISKSDTNKGDTNKGDRSDPKSEIKEMSMTMPNENTDDEKLDEKNTQDTPSSEGKELQL